MSPPKCSPINRRTRTYYTAGYKLKVVHAALQRPEASRIKPTCRDYPGIEPVRSGRPLHTVNAQ